MEGAIVEMGSRFGIPTPINGLLLILLQPINEAVRGSAAASTE
jgi:hypothetical protein